MLTESKINSTFTRQYVNFVSHNLYITRKSDRLLSGVPRKTHVLLETLFWSTLIYNISLQTWWHKNRGHSSKISYILSNLDQKHIGKDSKLQDSVKNQIHPSKTSLSNQAWLIIGYGACLSVQLWQETQRRDKSIVKCNTEGLLESRNLRETIKLVMSDHV